MSRNSFLSFATFVVAASMSFFFTACGPATSCSASTCAGCCDAMGLCQAGVVSVFVQAGRGLAAAHQAGVVPRDFKPDTVLAVDGGAARRPRNWRRCATFVARG